MLVTNALRHNVITSDQPIPTLYEENVFTLKDKGHDLLNAIPKFKNIKQSLYDARNKELGVPATIFKSIDEVTVPEKFRESILADYYYDGTRILVFCPIRCRKMICNITEYFVDGTFAVCPTPFSQIYNILGDIGSTFEKTKVVPLISAFMSNRTQNSYELLFHMIQSRLPEFKPYKVHCDYESAAINAIKENHPNVIIKGCYYHWCKNIWKNAKKFKNNQTKPEKRIVALTAVLPLLPPQYTLEGWEYIKTQIYRNKNINMTKFICYIENYWLKIHSPDVFSVFGERHRTDNVSEGFHSKLIKGINKTTVSLFRTMNKMNKYLGMETLEEKRKSKYIIDDDFILDVQMQLINDEITVAKALDELR